MIGRLILPLIVLATVCIAVFGARLHERFFAQHKRSFTSPAVVCKIKDSQINESSGIASDPTRKNIFYTHNDSGDQPRFFVFDSNGMILRVVSVANAVATDWEDMASAIVRGRPYLYFADIGDNSKKRETISIYRVPVSDFKSASLAADLVLTLKYPDGAHNAEALLVKPNSGDVYVVTKTSSEPAAVYKLSAPAKSGTYTFSKVGEVKIAAGIPEAQLITGGAIAPDGKHVVLRTYLAAYEFAVPTKFDDWMKGPAAMIRLAVEPQGEAICYSKDSKSLYTSSEGTPCTVSQIQVNE